MRNGIRLTGLAVLALSLGLVPGAWAAEGEAGGNYAGSDKCIECHEDQDAAMKWTEHGRAGFAKLDTHGCESCHGPSAAHVANPKDGKVRPVNPSKQSADDVVANCRRCHDNASQLHWMGGVHQQRGVSCIDCHSVHSPASNDAQLKGEDEMDTCFQCHKEIRNEIRKTSHHPIREGEISCSDCHNPHGTMTDKMLNATSVNDQCYQCHTEKRGPFLWEHAPVREDCLNCHNPHGSNHQKLQKTSTPYLCQQCHMNTRHPGTLYDANTLPGAVRQSNREFNRSCLNCHAAIHGSNHPSGPYLGR